jgi:transposase-like protein
MNITTEKKSRRVVRSYSAKEKGTALLGVWSGRRRRARVCKELGINWGLFNSWEKRAIRGIKEALEVVPGKPQTEMPGLVRLGPRLESLLEKMEPVKVPAMAEKVEETAEKN